MMGGGERSIEQLRAENANLRLANTNLQKAMTKQARQVELSLDAHSKSGRKEFVLKRLVYEDKILDLEAEVKALREAMKNAGVKFDDKTFRIERDIANKRKALERAEREAKETVDVSERERAQREKAEQERAQQEKARREKAQRERDEQEKAQREKAEQERAQQEKAQREKEEQEKAAQEKAAQEKERQEREEKQMQEKERRRKELEDEEEYDADADIANEDDELAGLSERALGLMGDGPPFIPSHDNFEMAAREYLIENGFHVEQDEFPEHDWWHGNIMMRLLIIIKACFRGGSCGELINDFLDLGRTLPELAGPAEAMLIEIGLPKKITDLIRDTLVNSARNDDEEDVSKIDIEQFGFAEEYLIEFASDHSITNPFLIVFFENDWLTDNGLTEHARDELEEAGYQFYE